MDMANAKKEIPFKAGVIPGKLIACEVHSAQGLVRRVDFNQSNMMSMRVIHRLAGAADPYAGEYWVYGIADQFRYCRLGTGAAPNPSEPANLLSLATPILSWTGTQYLASSVDYNSTTSTVDLENDDIRYRWRISHQHPYATADVAIAELGYADSTNPEGVMGSFINSRVVLPTPIPLETEQYLVTIYEFSMKLPSIVTVPVASMNIEGVPVTSAQVRLSAGHASANGEVTVAGVAGGATQMVNVIGILRGTAQNPLGGPERTGAGGGAFITPLASFTPLGNGAVDSGQRLPNVTRVPYNYDGIATRTHSMARDYGAAIRVASIFIQGFQFLLEEPFDRYQDQSMSITASIKWELLQGMD